MKDCKYLASQSKLLEECENPNSQYYGQLCCECLDSKSERYCKNCPDKKYSRKE